MAFYMLIKKQEKYYIIHLLHWISFQSNPLMCLEQEIGKFVNQLWFCICDLCLTKGVIL